jgi:pimeloyl-ACP methyl ester carboxylesterase
MKKFIFILIILFPLRSFSQELQIYSDLRMGKNSVGFETSYITDSSRTYKGEKRILQISHWFPSITNNSLTQLTLGDYVDLMVSETNPSDITKAKKELAANAFIGHYSSTGVNTFKLKRDLIKKVYADKNSQVKNSKFPVIFFVQGRSDSPVRNFAMYEYLASNGYHVFSIPAIGTNKREVDFNLTDLKSQVQDQTFLYRHVLNNFPSVDKENIFYIGYSYGSMTSLLMAMKYSGIKAMVSLDGSIGFADRFKMIKSSNGYDSSKFDIPLLVLNSMETVRNDMSLIDELSSNKKYLLSFKNFDHLDFTSFGLLSIYENIMKQRRPEYFRIQQLYMYDYILEFLRMAMDTKKFIASRGRIHEPGFLRLHKEKHFPKEFILFKEL